MRIQNNITAMNTHRMYTINNSAISKSAEKLSSGYRINRAGDDAAGLAISEKMRAQIRGLSMASKNSQDAISLVQTAEGALQESHNILQRMRELSVQSASDTNETSIDRAALQAEFKQLIQELDDTASKTKFNDMGLIDGSFAENLTTAVGNPTGTTGSYGAAWAAPSVEAGTYNITWEQKVTTATVTGVAATATTAVDGGNLAHSAAGAGTITYAFAIGTGEDVQDSTLNGEWTFGFDENKGMFTATNSATGEKRTSVAATLANGDNTVGFGNLGTLTINVGGTGSIDVSDIQGFTGKITVTDGVTAASAIKTDVVNLNGEEIKLEEGQDTILFEKTGVSLKLANVYSEGTDLAGSITVSKMEQKPLVIQTGANQGDELRINIDKMNALTLGVKHASISNRLSASAAITQTNTAVNLVSTQRAALGALQNRLNHKISNLDNTAENLQAAESRIRDIDIAKEMTAFTKANILSQASTAMLAQANSAPQSVLSLLQ